MQVTTQYIFKKCVILEIDNKFTHARDCTLNDVSKQG